jgi:hypothetical protein
MGDMRNAYKILVGKPKGKKKTWKTLVLAEVWWENVGWIHLAQDRD